MLDILHRYQRSDINLYNILSLLNIDINLNPKPDRLELFRTVGKT